MPLPRWKNMRRPINMSPKKSGRGIGSGGYEPRLIPKPKRIREAVTGWCVVASNGDVSFSFSPNDAVGEKKCVRITEYEIEG